MKIRTITYSRNVFIPVTNVCRNKCHYCGFRRDPHNGWLMKPDEIKALGERARAAGYCEALITLGERPEVYPSYSLKLSDLGYRTTVDYLVDISRMMLNMNLLPHTNAGSITYEEMKKLRRYNASMGLMLECATRLPAHEESPGKRPEIRLEVIRNAGELKIPFTTGLLIGIGESRKDRLFSLFEIKKLQERYGHIQEVIIQPFSPKPNTVMESCPPPSLSEVIWTVRKAREILEDVAIQVPPNLIDLSPPNVLAILDAGANDFGGISPITPDFINPENPWPEVEKLRTIVESLGFRLRERLPIYPKFVMDEQFMSAEVKRIVRSLSDEAGYRAG
ncbi:MAG: 7,8-didemethyl-8-hydroxy-5-deazariboflavin synthase subunit CofG [Candidatus Hadarchaeales archaeon]